MKIYKSTSLLLMVVGLGLAGLALSATPTLAYRGDPNVKGPNYTAERHESMTKAFASGNYAEWKKLMNDAKGRVTQVINQSNFGQFTQAHKLMLAGKTDEANKIKQSLGLGLRNGNGRQAGGQGMRQGYNR